MEPTRERVKESTRPYLEAELGFRNHWYPALFAYELKGEDPKPVTMLGEKILIRRVDARLYAIEDRCAHRRVQLSAKLECYTKDTVTCWYHGFTYSFRDGNLVQVVTDPQCPLIGKLSVRTQSARSKASFSCSSATSSRRTSATTWPPAFSTTTWRSPACGVR